MTWLVGKHNILKVLLDNHATLYEFKNAALVSNITVGKKASIDGIDGSHTGVSTVQVFDFPYDGVGFLGRILLLTSSHGLSVLSLGWI